MQKTTSFGRAQSQLALPSCNIKFEGTKAQGTE